MAFDIPEHAKRIFEQTYLQPFSLCRQRKLNVYEPPLERVVHGAQHAARVAAYIKVLVNFCRGANITAALTLQSQEVTLLQIVALFHDAARQNDGKDLWEQESAELCRQYLLNLGVKMGAQRFSQLIVLKEQGGFLGELLQSADCLDIMRCKETFIINNVAIYKYLSTPALKSRFHSLAKQILGLIAVQHDLGNDCSIKFDNGYWYHYPNKTRDLEKKREYEHAPNCYKKVIVDFPRFPLLGRLYGFKEEILSPCFKYVGQYYYFQDDLLNNIFTDKHACLVKAIRGDKHNFWHQFINSITRSPSQQKRYDYRVGIKQKFSVNGNGVYERAQKQHQYTPEEKQDYSQPQAVSLITRIAQTPLFGLLRIRRDKLVGVVIDLDNALLTDRLLRFDINTAKRPYDSYGHKYVQQDILFSKSEFAQFQTCVENDYFSDTDQYNEVLARIKWGKNSRIIIGSDTFEARLLAQDRARTLRARLEQQAREFDSALDPDYKIPIVFYLPGHPRHCHIYTEDMQQQDRAEAKRILFDSVASNEKMQAENFEFLLGLESEILTNVLQNGNYINIPILLYILRQGYVDIAESLVELAPSYRIGSVASHIEQQSPVFRALYGSYAQDNTLCRTFVKMWTADCYKSRALTDAIKARRWEHAVWLIGQGPHIKFRYDSFVCQAACEGKLPVIRFLLDQGEDPNVAGGWYGATPLQGAASEGRLDSMDLLLQRGAKLEVTDSRGKTPLHSAAEGGHLNVMDFLFQRGVDPNVRDSCGQTPLYDAARKGRLDSMDLLLQRGAKLDVTDSRGKTLFHSAAEGGHLNAVDFLFQHGVDPNLSDQFGSTPLHYAVCAFLNAGNYVGYEGFNIIAALLEHNANPNAKDMYGHKPLDIIIYYENIYNACPKVKDLLLSKGATPSAASNHEGLAELYPRI